MRVTAVFLAVAISATPAVAQEATGEEQLERAGFHCVESAEVFSVEDVEEHQRRFDALDARRFVPRYKLETAGRHEVACYHWEKLSQE